MFNLKDWSTNLEAQSGATQMTSSILITIAQITLSLFSAIVTMRNTSGYQIPKKMRKTLNTVPFYYMGAIPLFYGVFSGKTERWFEWYLIFMGVWLFLDIYSVIIESHWHKKHIQVMSDSFKTKHTIISSIVVLTALATIKLAYPEIVTMDTLFLMALCILLGSAKLNYNKPDQNRVLLHETKVRPMQYLMVAAGIYMSCKYIENDTARLISTVVMIIAFMVWDLLSRT